MYPKETAIFRCAIPGCGATYFAPRKGNYDEARLAYTKAKEDGWHFKKRRGGYDSYCPDCAMTPNDDAAISWEFLKGEL
jgi:hypothetical protein